MTTSTIDQSGACPSFFRGCIARARICREGYSDAAYHLMIHLPELVEGDVDDAVLNEFREAVTAADGEAVWRWLRRTLPRCMALVPTRRKVTFLRGVAAAIEEGRI